MPYSLLIGLGAGFVSAVVFASATTGPMFSRLLLFLLTPLALFLAGLGAGPTIAVIAGIAGTAIVWAAGSAAAAVVFATSQAVPAIVLVYLASLNRTTATATDCSGPSENLCRFFGTIALACCGSGKSSDEDTCTAASVIVPRADPFWSFSSNALRFSFLVFSF